jgi:tetratricopeptide (TPR) repeat protein
MLARSLSFIARIAIILVATATTPAVFAQLEPLRGTVVSKADEPLDEVQVALRSPDSSDAVEEIITGDDGAFSFPMEILRPEYEIHLHKDGYDDVILPINPQQLVVATIKVTLLRTKDEPSATPTPSRNIEQEQLEAAKERRERAVRLYNDAIKKYEDDEDEKQSKIEAMQMFRESASIDPTFREPLQILARTAIKQQNWAEASRYSESLIRIDPNDDEAITNLYISLVIMRHFDRVGGAAKRLIYMDPDKMTYVESHAEEFYKNHIYTMARALYQALTEVAPEEPNGYLNLGLCCAALGDTEGMRAAYEKFIELAPEDHEDIEAIKRELAALDSPGQIEGTEDLEVSEEPQEPE